MTKKAAALLLAVSLAVSVCAMPVFADDPTSNTASATGTNVTNAGQNTQTKTDIEYVVEASYNWSVPVKITFTSDTVSVTTDGTSGNTQNVYVSNHVIPNDKKLQITVDSNTTTSSAGGTDNEFAIEAHGAKLKYEISKKNGAGEDFTKVELKGTVMEVASGVKEQQQILKFDLTKDTGTNVSEKAGSYSGVAVFTAQLVAAT